jgi:hypothetical protein
VPQILALGALEAVQFPHATRIALRCLLALGLSVAMAAWIRANRPACDLQEWCDCAGAQMTVRVIESRRPQVVGARIEAPVMIATAITTSPTIATALADEDYEITIR